MKKQEIQSRWKRRYSVEHDREFYENTEPEDTVWEVPEGAVIQPLPKG